MKPFFNFPRWQDMPGLEREPFRENHECSCCKLYGPNMLPCIGGKWVCQTCNGKAVHIDLVAIDRFRDSLPEHRLGWFSSLRIEDQARLAEGYVLNEDGQKDFDEAYDEMGPELFETKRQSGGLI